MQPEREHPVVQNINGFVSHIIGIERSVWCGQQFSPDHRAVGIRIDDDSYFFCGVGSGYQVILSDDGFSVFHQIFECLCLTELGNPRLTVFIGFKPVFPVPSGQDIRPLMAYCRTGL